jgi:hypothetical protein
MGKLLLTIGILGLCHAAYSATQHRNYIRLTEHDLDENLKQRSISSLPIDILLQTLVSLFLSCIGIIRTSAKFKQIKITSEWESKTWDNIYNRTSFYTFNHRGKYLFTNEAVRQSPLADLSVEEREAMLNRYRAAASAKFVQQAGVDDDEESGSISGSESNQEN